MASTIQQTVSQTEANVDAQEPLNVLIPTELKERLRHIQFERRVSYRDLVIDALESAYPAIPRKKAC